MRDYLCDRHVHRRFRFGHKCPLPLAHVYIAERFGQWPWDLRYEPADEVDLYLSVLEYEAEISNLLEGAPTDTWPNQLIFEWDDDEGDFIEP